MATENEDLHASGGGLDGEDDIGVGNDPADSNNVTTDEKEDKTTESNEAKSTDDSVRYW
jgi:hypothetical protein